MVLKLYDHTDNTYWYMDQVKSFKYKQNAPYSLSKPINGDVGYYPYKNDFVCVYNDTNKKAVPVDHFLFDVNILLELPAPISIITIWFKDGSKEVFAHTGNNVGWCMDDTGKNLEKL